MKDDERFVDSDDDDWEPVLTYVSPKRKKETDMTRTLNSLVRAGAITRAEAAIELATREWDESKHPRAPDGKFGSGGGGGKNTGQKQQKPDTHDFLDNIGIEGDKYVKGELADIQSQLADGDIDPEEAYEEVMSTLDIEDPDEEEIQLVSEFVGRDTSGGDDDGDSLESEKGDDGEFDEEGMGDHYEDEEGYKPDPNESIGKVTTDGANYMVGVLERYDLLAPVSEAGYVMIKDIDKAIKGFLESPPDADMQHEMDVALNSIVDTLAETGHIQEDDDDVIDVIADCLRDKYQSWWVPNNKSDTSPESSGKEGDKYFPDPRKPDNPGSAFGSGSGDDKYFPSPKKQDDKYF